jgi:hypothetical protein
LRALALVLLCGGCGLGTYRDASGRAPPSAGDGCKCADEIGLQWVSDDYDGHGNIVAEHVLVECVPADPSLTDRDPATVCIGSHCCEWTAPQGRQ